MTAVSFDAKTGNYFAKVGSKTIKSYSKAYVERRVKAMVGDIETAVAVAVEKSNKFKELANKKGSREYNMWFLKYIPGESTTNKVVKTQKIKKTKNPKTRKQRRKKTEDEWFV